MKLFNFLRPKTNTKEVHISKESESVHFEGTKYLIDKIEFNSTMELIDVLNLIKDNESFCGIELNRPATDDEIDLFEASKEIKLPKDFKTIYKFSNGFETDEDLFRLIPLNEIIDNGKDDYCINDNSFHFTEYMIYSDMWTVEINPNDIENYRIYNKAENIVYLTNSLTEFLCVFLNKGIYEGLYEWREKKQIVSS
ncbi:SMI1/KNR4 family protein [Flavivirga algicola]|uniref:SMI1/KNR4 family protein n=1 Tax=Flavivirga algicola TaxID=2729136 RepID=A0ABX1RYP3_9FLAO|nr:SMI1/KNR4 family protein [Flavivirga algicola]NMH88697.1 SMI1/KNR4 family protein [Flavivirga algicola]